MKMGREALKGEVAWSPQDQRNFASFTQGNASATLPKGSSQLRIKVTNNKTPGSSSAKWTSADKPPSHHIISW